MVRSGNPTFGGPTAQKLLQVVLKYLFIGVKYFVKNKICKIITKNAIEKCKTRMQKANMR